MDAVIYVADAGSVARRNFHWVRSAAPNESGCDPEELADAIAADLSRGRCVALGYESPLFIPVEPAAAALGAARVGECQPETSNRPFNAGAGAAVLATGLQSLAWVLRRVRQLYPAARGTTRWDDFRRGDVPLLVWEAFVSGSEKAVPPSHAGDAALALEAFRQALARPDNPTRMPQSQALGLAAAALLFAGLADDAALLTEPCVVIRPLFSPPEAAARLQAYHDRQAQRRQQRRGRRSSP